MNFYVYVLQEVKASATAPIKIGVACDVGKRFSTLQTGNPRELIVRLTFGPMSKPDAFELERYFFQQLRPYRLRGEWYSGKALTKILAGRSAA